MFLSKAVLIDRKPLHKTIGKCVAIFLKGRVSCIFNKIMLWEKKTTVFVAAVRGCNCSLLPMMALLWENYVNQHEDL